MGKRFGVSLVALVLMGIPVMPVLHAQELSPTRGFHRDTSHLRFRGVLMGQRGRQLTEPQTVTFTIRDAKRDGTVRWQESQLVHPDQQGRYVALLGSNSAVGLSPELIRDHSVLWVTAEGPDITKATTPVITTPQGIYQDCNLDGQSCQGLPGDTAISQLQQIASGGFILVLNYSAFWGTAAELQNYATQASNLGVNIIWSFDDPDFATYASKTGQYLINDYAELSATCQCTTNKAFLQYIVGLTSKMPATWGYSIADEPVPSTSTQVKSLYTVVHQADPNHPAMINATYDDATQPTLANLQKNLDPFNFADVLGADFYPWGTGAPISNVIPASKNTQTIANNYGKQSQFVLQANSWQQEQPDVCSGPCTFPSVSQMQTMLNDAAANMTPSILMWFDYWDTVNAGQWSNLITAANPQP